MLSTATSANVGFSQVVQLLGPPQTLLSHLAEKIPFINSEKNYSGCQLCAHKYYGLVGFSRVRGRGRVRVRVRLSVSVRVSIRVSLVYLVCVTTLGNNVAPSVRTDGK